MSKREYTITADKYTANAELPWIAVEEWLEHLQDTVHLSVGGKDEPVGRVDLDMLVVCLRTHFDELVDLFAFLMFMAKHGNIVKNNGSRINYDCGITGKSISADRMSDAGLLNDFGNTNFNINDGIIEKIKKLIEYAKKEPLSPEKYYREGDRVLERGE